MDDTPMPVKQPGDMLTPKEVAAENKLSEKTLANWRSTGEGPRYVRFGKRAIRYRRADVEAFIAAGNAGEVAA